LAGRPAHLRPAQVAHRARLRTQRAALGRTATRAVRSRLAQDPPLGYSATIEVFKVVEAGSAVSGLRPGQLVATGGAEKANHAEFQAVPGLLCAAVPTCAASPSSGPVTQVPTLCRGWRTG
jgi:NADPH:quinone reductase-like Zn-dependent oxidoreductase